MWPIYIMHVVMVVGHGAPNGYVCITMIVSV